MRNMIIAALKKIDNLLFAGFCDQYPKMLEREILGSCETLLEVGCGSRSPIRRFSRNLQYSVGIDCYAPVIIESRRAAIHNEYKILDALEIGEVFAKKSFDCVLASDLIEHLSKEDGLKLIAMMEAIARKKVIIFTPNGFLPQNEYAGNEFQAHLSGWEVDEMKNKGFVSSESTAGDLCEVSEHASDGARFFCGKESLCGRKS